MESLQAQPPAPLLRLPVECGAASGTKARAKNQWEKSMEKIIGKNQWEKTMGKNNGKNQWEKTMGKSFGKIVPRAARKKNFTFCSGAE